MRIALTADLHWGHGAAGDAATQLLVQHLREHPPDLLLLGGDIGTGDHFAECLTLFDDLACAKALVPGNHDIWVSEHDPRGNSLEVYTHHLPAVSRAAGFHYLDAGPLLFPKHEFAVVGTINWYDYSWSLERLQQEVPDWQWRLERMAFTRGRHNDRRFVRWPLDDVRFTELVTTTFQRQLQAALQQVPRALILTHHPAFYDLSFPRAAPPSVPDGLLWDAFSGNARLEKTLRDHCAGLMAIFSGHTHRARQSDLDGVRGFNIGGDYHFKQLLIMAYPGLEVDVQVFGNVHG